MLPSPRQETYQEIIVAYIVCVSYVLIVFVFIVGVFIVNGLSVYCVFIVSSLFIVRSCVFMYIVWVFIIYGLCSLFIVFVFIVYFLFVGCHLCFHFFMFIVQCLFIGEQTHEQWSRCHSCQQSAQDSSGSSL